MDEETRSAIDSLISGKKRSRPTHPSFRDPYRAPRPSEPTWTERIRTEIHEARLKEEAEREERRLREERAREESIRREREELDRIRHEDMERHRSAHTTKPDIPTFCYGERERGLLNLKNETATLSVDTSSASIVFKGPINDKLVKRIETAVPVTQREWMESKKAWRFSPACLAILKPILKDEYKDVQMLGVPKALPSTKFDQLMAKLSKEDKAQVYRLLAAKYHPDKGGSHEVMTLINIVFRG